MTVSCRRSADDVAVAGVGTVAGAGGGEPGTAVTVSLPPHSEQKFAPGAFVWPHAEHRGGGSAAPH